MNNREVIEELVLRILESKRGPNNVKLAYAVGYLESILNRICLDHPDVQWFLKRQLELLE